MSTLDFQFIRIVRVEGCEEKWISRALSLLQGRGHDPVCLNANDVLKDKVDCSNLIFILESFDSDCYKRLHGQATVLSARVIVELAENDFNYPSKYSSKNVINSSRYSFTMADISMTFTSVAREERTKLREMVRLMGGEATGDLTVKTTHLVCGEVKSLKYQIASKANLPIVLPSWVEFVWKEVTTSDAIFTASKRNLLPEHRCGVFQGLVICVTGLDVIKRKEVQTLAHNHGGAYSGEMKRDDCTHLLVEKPDGQKYMFARRWQLSTVHPSWFFDSVSAGACLPEGGYAVSQMESSETSSFTPLPSQPWAVQLNEFKPPPDLNGQTMAHCKIYLSGFVRVHTEKLSNLIQLLGAVRLKQLNSSVTHVVVGQEDQEETKKLKKVRSKVKLVRVEWLLECAQSCQCVDEGCYPACTGTSAQVNGGGGGGGGEGGEGGGGGGEDVQPTGPTSTDEEENDIMKLYTGTSVKEEKAVDNVLSNKHAYLSSLHTEDTRRRVAEVITGLGGTVIPSPSGDFSVLPLFINPEVFDSETGQGTAVTICWIESLKESGQCVSPDSYFLYRPIACQRNRSCLEGCLLYVSQHEGLRRQYLNTLASKLGAKISDNFQHDCTHLVLREPTGEKYKASVKWGVSAVRDSWLFMCAKSGSKISEASHLVTTAEPQKVASVEPATTPKQPGHSEVITPFRPLQPNTCATGFRQAMQSANAATQSQQPANTQKIGAMFSEAMADLYPNTDDQIVPVAPEPPKPFNDVVVFVNKKSVKIQGGIHSRVVDLGGRVLWSLDSSCTHYVYNGRKSDISKLKELKQAKKSKSHIVSPEWIYSSFETNSKQDEERFPCFYKRPKLAQGVLEIEISTQPAPERTSVGVAEPSNMDVSQPPDTSPVEDNDCGEPTMDCSESADPEPTNKSNSVEVGEGFVEQLGAFQEQLGTTTNRSKSRIQGGTDKAKKKEKPLPKKPTHPVQRSSTSKITRSASKRRKVAPANEESNSLDTCVKWDTTSQTVTYDNSLASSGRQEIMAMIRTAEEGDSDGPSPEGAEVPDDIVKPSLVVPIVTKTDACSKVPCQVLYEERQQTIGLRSRQPQRKFMFSAITAEMRANLGSLISDLKGQVVDAQFFNHSCTHLIVGKASRNEKYLASLAAGKWVLHASYLDACREAGKFVQEEPYEWGTVVSGKQPTPLEEAAKNWRVRLADKHKTAGKSVGAFSGWKIFLAVDSSRLSGMKRLLEAGGAEVLGVRAPFERAAEATHAFLDLNKIKATVGKDVLKKWTEMKINCFKPDFIAEFLMHDNQVDQDLHRVSIEDLS